MCALYFDDDPWYRVVGPEAPAARTYPVFRQPAGSGLFNTLAITAPAVALEVDAFAFHHGSSIVLPRLTARPNGVTEDFRGGDAQFMHAVREQRPDLYERYCTAATEGGASSHALGNRALVLIAVTYRFLERNPRFRLLLSGHTDSSGDDSHNFALSDRRAESVLALLTGDRDAWVETCLWSPKSEDVQFILKHLADVFGWSCDPGAIDDEDGPATEAAIRGFQQACARHTGRPLAVDGTVGTETWGAVFDCLMDELAELMETTTERLPDHRARLRFVDEGQRTIGCGERVPLSGVYRDHFRSEADRRVEILFFHEARLPSLSAHAPGGDMRNAGARPEKSGVYAPDLFEFAFLDPVWWSACPPGPRETPHYRAVKTERPDTTFADERSEERYETALPVTEPSMEPWDFLDDLDDHHPGTLFGD